MAYSVAFSIAKSIGRSGFASAGSPASSSGPQRLDEVLSPNLQLSPQSTVLSPEETSSAISLQPSALIKFRPYQEAAFLNRSNGIEVWLWGRQTGKSFTLAAWAVDRLITRPGRTVTVLSNSRFNGAELNLKCAEVCNLLGQAFQQADLSDDQRFEKMRFETRITIHGKVGRILVLAANPLTARSFSGDLILDEFAFHEDSHAIWNAASPILNSNPDFLCRIASTPNGKFNEFYRLISDPAIPKRIVTRTEAWKQGCLVYHPVTRESITPDEARALAPNKRAYDQNFECAFEDQNSALLTYDLIQAAERPDVGVICEQEWTPQCIAFLRNDTNVLAALGSLFADTSYPSLAPQSGRGIKGEGNSALSAQNSELKKPARDWLAQAEDEEEVTRALLQVCNGSIDRYFLLLQSGHPVALTDRFTLDQLEMMTSGSSRSLVPNSPSHSYPPAFTLHPSGASRALFAGVDVGRNNDRTVVSIVERSANTYLLRAVLRLENMRLPHQQLRLEEILRLQEIRCCKIDMTGLGLGLFEYTQEKFGARVQGINFATTVPLSAISQTQHSGLSAQNSNASVRITEALATSLLQAFEDRAIQIPVDQTLREDLRKPERLLSPSGRVSIAATRSEAGHADHFWSLALALNAAQTPVQPPLQYHAWKPVYKSRMPLL